MAIAATDMIVETTSGCVGPNCVSFMKVPKKFRRCRLETLDLVAFAAERFDDAFALQNLREVRARSAMRSCAARTARDEPRERRDREIDDRRENEEA